MYFLGFFAPLTQYICWNKLLQLRSLNLFFIDKFHNRSGIRFIHTMAESSSFSSLLALVDSHLSKTNIKKTVSEDANDNFSNLFQQSLNNLQQRSKQGYQSETGLSTFLNETNADNRNIPFKTEINSTQKVLNMQIANMIKAKELRQQQEEILKLEKEVKKVTLEEDNYMIDLSEAIIKPFDKPMPPKNINVRSSSVESLFEPQFIDTEESKDVPQAAPSLPCTTDLSYILLQPKPWKTKCSRTARILSTRLKRVPAPYLLEKYPTNIPRFKFNTMSPCDMIKNNLNKRELTDIEKIFNEMKMLP